MRRGTVWACVAGIVFGIILLGRSVSNAEMFVPSRVIQKDGTESVTVRRLQCQLQNSRSGSPPGLRTALEIQIDQVKAKEVECGTDFSTKFVQQQTATSGENSWINDNAHFWSHVNDCAKVTRTSDIRGVEFQLDTYLEPTSAEDRKYVFVGLGKSKSDNTEKPDTENVFGVYLSPCFTGNAKDCRGAYFINVADSKNAGPDLFYHFTTNGQTDTREGRNRNTCGPHWDGHNTESNRRWCGRAFLTDRIAIIVDNDDSNHHKFELYVNGILRFEGKQPAEHDYTYFPILSTHQTNEKHRIHHPSFIRDSTVTFQYNKIGPTRNFLDMMNGQFDTLEGIRGYRYLGPNFDECHEFNKPKDSSVSFVEKSLTTNAKSKLGNKNGMCEPRVIDTGTGKNNALSFTAGGLGPITAFLGAGADRDVRMPELKAFKMDNDGKKTNEEIDNLELVPDPNSLLGVRVKFKCTSGTENLCCPTEDTDIFVQVMDRTKGRTKMFYAHVRLDKGTTGLSMEWCTANSQQDCEHQFATRRRRLLVGRKSSFC